MELSHAMTSGLCHGGLLSGSWLRWSVKQRSSRDECFWIRLLSGRCIHAEPGLTTNYPDQAAIHRTLMRSHDSVSPSLIIEKSESPPPPLSGNGKPRRLYY